MTDQPAQCFENSRLQIGHTLGITRFAWVNFLPQFEWSYAISGCLKFF